MQRLKPLTHTRTHCPRPKTISTNHGVTDFLLSPSLPPFRSQKHDIVYQVENYLLHFERCERISAELFEAIIQMCKLKNGKSYLSQGKRPTLMPHTPAHFPTPFPESSDDSRRRTDLTCALCPST